MENKSQLRFKDQGHTNWQFLSEIFVHCPKCSLKATITKPDVWRSVPELHCPNCHFSQIGKSKSWTLEVKLYCPNCANRIERKINGVTSKKEKIKIKCENCGETHAHAPRYELEEHITYGRYDLRDPFFELDLWLAGQIKNHNFWAYNYKHLQMIKDYVQASHRIRANVDYQTMVEKLPIWVKSKKNRAEMISLIDDLEKK